ncbi:AAA family ATPase [Vibrio ostreicida]|uniref:AAA family ATPase n=1 Tax=Vibrio ostreicida TaxID=526588 RepID=UPI000970D129|nr:SMC family ATPase [Vibrio ostreicida]
MKPMKLTMQAFGPFATKEDIDFTLLGSHPLFLINGPTGSGKTSILDAICYALYGETTSNERQGIQMRCDQAAEQLLTEVELEFGLKDKRYRVIRSPEQQAPKSRGEGMTTRKHTASLYDVSQEARLLTSKTAEVKTEVTALLGLNESQFRQVMVLPQGKFRELLLASSKDREAIFGQLFQTDVYKKIEYALKDKAGSIIKAKEEFDHQIRGALQVAEVETETALIQRQVALNREFTVAQEQEHIKLEMLNSIKAEFQNAKRLAEQFSKLDEAERCLKQHQDNRFQVIDYKDKLNLALQANKLELPYKNWQAANAQVKEFEDKLSVISIEKQDTRRGLDHQQRMLDKAKNNADQRPQLNQQLFQLDQIKGQLADKAELEAAIQMQRVQKDKDQATLTHYTELKGNLVLEAEKETQALEQARKDLAEKVLLEAEIEKNQRLLSDLKKLSALQAEATLLDHQIRDKQTQVDTAHQALKAKQQRADELELCWHNTQASVLAQKLKHKQPCPVCGSQEHPSPAQTFGDDVSKDTVQLARQEERLAFDAYNQYKSLLEQHRIRQDQNRQLIHELNHELSDAVSEGCLTVEQRLSVQRERLHQLSLIDLLKMEQSVLELNKRCSMGEIKINQLKETMSANDSALNIHIQQCEKLSRSIDPQFSSISVVKQQYKNLQSSIETLTLALENAQQSAQQMALEMTKLESQFNTNKQLLTQAREQQQFEHNVWLQCLENSEFSSERHYLTAMTDEQQIEHWQKAVTEYEHMAARLEQTVSDLTEQLKNAHIPDLEQWQVKLDEADQHYQQCRTSLDGIRSLHQRIEKVREDITQLHQKNTQLEAQYKVYGTLYDVASGKTGSRVSLHRFVLGVLLDDVLIQASQRLRLMSKGRYQLVRKTEGFKGVAGRGLDLSVEDGYTGKTRDVATLSGGESFMAALALALGLSDVVQSYSGGIRLETLFIDEGFGSLDPESLDLAIQTLIDLQQAGRMIGLISHVSELKEQLSLRIDVVPSRQGSKVTLTPA